MSSTSTNLHTEFEAFAEKAGQDIKQAILNIRGNQPSKNGRRHHAVNGTLDQVRAKYMPGVKVPAGSHCADMLMYPIREVPTRGWPNVAAILKPGPDISTHHWSQSPKPILKEQEEEKGHKDDEDDEPQSVTSKPVQIRTTASPCKAIRIRTTSTSSPHLTSEACDACSRKQKNASGSFEMAQLMGHASHAVRARLPAASPNEPSVRETNPGPQPNSQSSYIPKFPSRAQSKAPSRAQSRAPSRVPSRAPTHRALQATSVAATSTHRSPSLEPAPSPAKKAKTSLSKSRTKISHPKRAQVLEEVDQKRS
ncbi:hypothetical protein BU15DRAFT_83095 [Melanogaster broomeanus]|nr:hypothetical protein BU15DRAFT_83095 [Melanogaster broomeanus]